MKPIISVIIPIYNVEKYLDKCLYSVRNQTLKNIEIICIDDCSPDDSHLIVQKHIEEDNRISLIRHKKNMGLGGARNTGIIAAKADYIGGVDSDDYIKPEMFEKLWDAIKSSSADVVICGFDQVDTSGNIVNSSNPTPSTIDNIDNSINIFKISNPNFWNKLWKKKLFIENNIYFPSSDYYEDMSTTPRILAKSKVIKLIEGQFYQYVVRPESITTSYGSKHILDYFKGFDIILDFLKSNDLFERYIEEFKVYANLNLNYHSNNVLNSDIKRDELIQYLQHFLLLKFAYFEYRDSLALMNENELQRMFKNDNSLHLENGLVFKQNMLIKKQEQELLNSRLIKINKENHSLSTDNLILDEINKSLKNKIHELEEKITPNNDIIKSKNALKIVTKENIKLSYTQFAGVLLFRTIFRVFYTKRQSLKLKENPRRFFSDSNSSLTQVAGILLNLR